MTIARPSEAELHARAARLRLVLTDNDGVLTDAGIYYDEEGEALKRCSMRDRMGFERLRLAGVGAAIVTAATTGLALGEFAFIGDDVNDGPTLRLFAEHGLTAAPSDALPEATARSPFRCSLRCGYRAFREFAEWLLSLRSPAP